MASILSQDEIDALLTAMQKGELDLDAQDKDSDGSDQVEIYNFRRPNLISKERLRGFNSMHEQLVRQVQSGLSLLMRSNLEVSIASIDQILYQEFVKMMDRTTHIELFTMEPLPGTGVMEFKLPLIYGVLDLLLGGKGDVQTEVRIMTEIEHSVIEPFLQVITENVAGVWNEVVEGSFTTVRTESDPEMVQSAPAEAPMVVVTVVCKIGNASGLINIAYPLPMVQTLLNGLDARSFTATGYYGKSIPKDYRKDIVSVLADMPLPVSVDLGRLSMTSRELESLAVGDVVILGTRTGEPLTLSVGRDSFCTVRPGRSGRKLAVKILENAEAKTRLDLIEKLLGSPQS